jgi:monoamine oxidase
LRGTSNEDLLTLALESLAYLFGSDAGYLRRQLRAYHVANWGADPRAYGAYAYATVGAEAARTVLTSPIAGTLFFAGEALHGGPNMGTVEAALVSGLAAAHTLAQHSSLPGAATRG